VRLLFLNPTGQFGGAEAALVELLAGLREAYPDWSLSVVAASDGPFVDRARALGASVAVAPFPLRLSALGEWASAGSVWARLSFFWACLLALPATVAYVRRLRRVVATLTPDIVQSNGAKMHLVAGWVTPPAAAVVWHVHDYVGRRALTSRLLRRLARRCSAVFANSASVAEDLRHVLGGAVPIYPVWNAVDLTRFAREGPALNLDQLAGLPPAQPGAVRVGLVATFARWKGHATFLRALGALPAALGVRGYVVGGPVYATHASQVTLAELKAIAADEGIESRVGFVGYVTDTAAAMRALDVVVHASTEPEPFGLVIAEGMACGRAVVVSAGGGAGEIVTPGVTALTHEPGSVEGLAACIRSLVSDPTRRAQLADAGRRAAADAFSRSRMVREMSPVYLALAAGRS
jgi:glycosyltransferase involved in cell wall biosynthesis